MIFVVDFSSSALVCASCGSRAASALVNVYIDHSNNKLFRRCQCLAFAKRLSMVQQHGATARSRAHDLPADRSLGNQHTFGRVRALPLYAYTANWLCLGAKCRNEMSVLPVSVVDDNGDVGGGNQCVGRILVCRGVDCAGIQHACAHACLRRQQWGRP